MDQRAKDSVFGLVDNAVGSRVRLSRAGFGIRNTRMDSNSYSEVMMAHLQTSMMMSWIHPPTEVARLLSLVDRLDFSVNHSIDSASVNELISRCGVTAVRKVLEYKKLDNETLDFSLLRDIQCSILGTGSAEFRRTSAFMDLRNERYGWFNGLDQLFAEKISRDSETDVHPLLKGIQLYLDIIFVHPFEDGNTRSAVLWLGHRCFHLSLPLPHFGSVMAFGFAPGNALNYWLFTESVLHSILDNKNV